MADPESPKGPDAGGAATLEQEEIDSLLGGEPGAANAGLGLKVASSLFLAFVALAGFRISSETDETDGDGA